MKTKFLTLVALLFATAAAYAHDLIALSDHGTVTFRVNNAVVTTANEGDIVNVKIAPEANYYVVDVKAIVTSSWGAAHAPRRATSIGIDKNIEVTKINSREYSFVMKSGNAKVTVTYEMATNNVDKTQLGIAIDDSNAYYERFKDSAPAPTAEFKRAIDAAQVVYDDPNATQEEVDKAKDDLDTAARCVINTIGRL